MCSREEAELKGFFSPVGEKEVTGAIVEAFWRVMREHTETEVIVVGGGPAGLMAARELAKAGRKVLLIERNNYLGGGFWLGGFLMNPTTFRAPSQEVLDEIGVPYEEVGEGLYLALAPHACSKLIASACEAGVEFLQMVFLEDVVLRERGRVAGVVINWMPISVLPREVAPLDPVALESKLVIDATGHEACVARKLEERGLLKLKGVGAMWIERSEELVVKHTGEVHPGLIVTGMAVTAVYGLPRMGPTFGAMLLSGKRAAEVALEKLRATD